MYESFLPPPPADIAPARSSGGDGNPLEQALAAERVTGPLADVARSVYHQESGSGSNTKTSNAGARGGMQIIPSTFASVADKGWDINDPVHNARGGVRYLKQLFEQSGGDPGLTAAGYYGGPGGMEKARRGIAVSDPRNPDAPNTLQYAQQVTSRLGASGAGIPASAAARAPVEQNDTPYYTPVTRHASLLPPPPPEEGVLASMGTALSQGAKSTARSIGAALNNLTGDLSGVENNRLAQLAAAEQDPAAKRSLMAEIEARKAANPDAGVLQAVGDVGSAALQNPLGTAQFVAEQAPNAVVSLGGGLAGSKLGALAGTPLGPVGIAVGGTVGFLAGMFLGNSLLEIGGKSIEKAEGGFTQGEANDALREGAVKGAVVTGVDAATLGAGKLISRGLSAGAVKAGARAEAQVLAAAGVDITSGEKIVAALADPALRASAAQAGQVAAKAASTLGNRATQAGTILATETVGEGAGEYYGELAATGKADLYDAATEALAGFAQSAPETFMAMTHSASTSMDPKAIRASAIEQQRQTELAPVQAAADAGGSLSKAAMAGNTGPLAAAQYAAGKEQELATQQQTAQAEQQANTPAADPLTARVRAITEEARNTGLLQALRAEGSPVDAKQFVNDLAIAQSPSTRPDQREQALSRLEYAASWVTGAKPLVPVGQPGNEPGQPGNEPGQSRNEPGQSKNEPGNTRNEPGQTANDLLSSNALSDADRQALTASLSASTNPALPQATRQAARQTANEIIGRNTAGAATTPLAPTAGTPALFAPKAAPAGSPEEVLAKARQQEDNAGQLTAMGYPDEAATATAQADLLREEAKVRQSATPDAPQAATKTVAASAGQASAAAEDAAPGKDVPAPSVATPSGTGTAQFRKRRAVLGALIADGLNQVERRNDGNFYLVDPSRKRQFKLDNAADAQLARKAREDAIRAAADETAKKISDAQKIAGNYKKGRPDFEDLKIGIETPIGSERSGKAPDGTPWSVTMTADYGDITSTKGGDGEAVDIYLAPNPKEGSPVFVIDQYNDDGSFDEHKVVLGVATEAEATAIYDAHFNDGSGPRRRKAVTAMAVPEFKTWVRSPAATQPAGKPNGTTGPDTKQGAAARPAAGATDAGTGVAAGESGSGRADDRGGVLPDSARATPVVSGVATAADAGTGAGYVTIRVGSQERQVALVNDPAANDASPPRADGARRINKANAALLHKLAGTLGKKVQFFRDDTLGDGFVDPATPGTVYLNEVSTIHPLAVFGHEFLHQLRQSMPAAHASLMKVVRAKLKKDGAHKFRNDYYKADAGPNPNSALNSAELEEITSDIGGNFMADVSFWAEVFAQVQKDSPAASKSLIGRMATQLFKLVDKLVDGIQQRGFGSSALVNDLKGVRAAFKDALAQYMVANNLTQAGMRAEALKAEQAQEKTSITKEVARSTARSPETGIHFSKQQRTEIDGRQYGTGMKGQELARLNSANDERLLARAYVYIDEGKGVTPETGVGTVPHEVKLPKLYDARVNADKLWNGGNLNATESAILDAGYSGYYVSGKDSAQGVAVVLGKASHQLKARPIAAAQNGAADAEPAKASRGLMSKELNAIEPANIPGATLKNGTLTIPMNSREAANDEMSRIGSAVRFSPARTADAPADQYAATLARLKDTDQWLKAPNGQATRLTERQWVQVRTPAFKAWFGDWEKFASQKGGVLADGQGEVSKAVDDNGEPIVVYHGTDTGGFAEFRKPGGTRRGDLGIFTTSNEEMARSYVRRGYGRRIAAIDDSGDKISGVYASFINLRTPNESDFEGANWDGQRLEQWVLEDAGTGDQLYAPDGRGFFNEEQLAAELERLNDLDISAIAREADDHYESTDGVMRDARRDKQDGAIVRQVMDDGGGNSGYWGAPSDVFVAFEPGQLKSADFNDGSFSVSTSDIRFSAGREQTETAAFKEWFGDSKVVDAEGDPLVVYHGTNNDFKEFDSSRLRTGAGDSVFGAGFYFTPSPRYAESYGPNVMSVYLALQKPYLPGYSEAADARVADKVSAAGYTELPEMSGDAQRAILESLGFDGVIAKEHPEDYDKEGVEQWDEIVVFSPSSIKSTRNGGGFSYASNDITQSAKRDPAIGDRTDVAQLPKGKAIPASAAIGSLEDSLTLARSKSYAKGRQLKVDIQDRVLAAAKSAKVDLSAKTQETFKFLTGLVVKDARLALQSNENAIGWYDKTVSRAIGALATVHPEIETDPKARLAFLWALATTSNGLKVGQNFKIAEEVYRGWKATGVMPSDAGIGNAKASIDKGLALYNTLAAKMGHERLFKFMATEFEVGQIGRMLGEAPGGEWMPTPVLGSAVLGPKIGNGFFSNLNGYFSALTMDRWLMRTWGRMTGTLLEVLPEKVAKSRTKLATSIASMNDTERKLMAKLIGTPLRRSMTRAELDAVSLAVQKTTTKPENREVMDASPGSSRLRLDGNGHAKILDGQKEAPAGPAERNWIRAVFTEALGELNTGGKAMTMSDLQALLWYPERRLYDAAKSDEDVADGYEDDEAPDYANAAQQLALKSGVKPEVITAAMDRAEKRGTVQGKRLSDAEKQAMLQEFRAPPEQAVQLAFEVAPDPADAGLIAQWGQLSLKDRTAITKKAKDAVLDELIDAVGAKVGKTVGATGGYMGLVNPNLITEYKHTQVPIEQARALASAIGLALDQDSVALVDPRAEYGAGLLRINFNGKVDKHAAAIFDALHAAIPEIDAFTARGNNFDVLNFTDMTNEALHDKMQDALADLSIPLEGTISFGDIKSELVEKADYENHIAGLRPGAGQEILGRVERARDRAREIVAQEIRSASDRGLQPRARKGAGRAAAARLDDVKLSANRDGDGAGRDQGRGLAPLAGAPTVQGAAGPDPRLVEVAEKYARANGITLRRQAAYATIDPARAQRIAQAYEAMPHAPQDPQVKAAYADLIRQTRNQYDALVSAGYRFTFFDSASDPYQGNPWNAMRELRKSHSMAVYGTYDGYGTEGVTDEALASNPMLADTGLQWRDQAGDLKPVLANDLFRAVHDAFGHGLEGAGFRAQGEENAWQAHVRLFTGPAVGAITSETRGQNSWLNYGPNGEANLNAKVEDTVFADQKTGLMPAWTWQEGIAGDEIRQSPARLEDAPLVELRKQLSVLESLRKCLG